MQAITRAVGPALARCELTYLAREPIDVDAAVEQHAAYRAALERAGIAVEVLPAEPLLPDAVFVEDAAVVFDELAVIARPGASARRPEVPAIETALARYREVARVEAPGTLDGGDVLRIGRECFVGLSTRTNVEGVQQLAAILARFEYRTTALEVRGCLHLKTAVTALDEETVLIQPGWIDARPFGRCRRLEVPREEPFGSNALSVGGVVHVSARSPRTRELLDAAGFRTAALRIGEFEKAEAGLTCLSLLF